MTKHKIYRFCEIKMTQSGSFGSINRRVPIKTDSPTGQ